MAELKTLWRHRRVVSKSFWLRRRAAGLVVSLTAPSGATVFVWLLIAGAIVGLWYGVHVVSAAHNPTLTWTVAVTFVVLFLLVFIPAASGGPIRLLRAGATATAIVNSLAYAYKVGDKIHAAKRSDIKSVRRMFGVVVLAGTSRSDGLVVPADLFPTRAQWRKLTGRAKPSVTSADPADSDIPKWGG